MRACQKSKGMWQGSTLFYRHFFYLKKWLHEKGKSVGFSFLQAFFLEFYMLLLKGALVKMNILHIFIELRAISPITVHAPTQVLCNSSYWFFKLMGTESAFSHFSVLKKRFTPFSHLSPACPVIAVRTAITTKGISLIHYFTTKVYKLIFFNVFCAVSKRGNSYTLCTLFSCTSYFFKNV